MSEPAGLSPAAATPMAVDGPVPPSGMDKLVLDYLRARGHKAAEQALLDVLDDGDAAPPPPTLDPVAFARELATFTDGPAPAETSEPTLQGLVAALGADEILAADPGDKQRGFRELESWVDGSLDMYRPEFRPILFPIFCHFYLDLVQNGYRDSAQAFYAEFASSLSTAHSSTLHHLSTLLLPIHVRNDDLAQRFRTEKYLVRMSRSGFGLLVGWLTEGLGGEAAGAGLGFSGEKGKRGRQAVMRVVNNHLRFDVTAAPTTSVGPATWEESTGLLGTLLPSAGAGAWTSAGAFNASGGALTLGGAPLGAELRAETERVLREHALLEPDGALPPPAFAPTELPPLPPAFRAADVRREVERVRDARKRIRLEPALLAGVDANSPQAAQVRARALPSVCAYTFHETSEGIPCATFSPDNSLLATGHSESYVRLWSLKGERLQGMRSDFQASAIKDAAGLRRLKEKGGSTTRKLIGHSGPVYAVAFDETHGSAAPPRHLLSASADGTARLWALDTLTNVVAYRGHQNPVWDVQWSPLGVYFATASRDRTARLWSTDRAATLRIYAGHLSDVDCVRFHPNSLYLATGSSDWTARLWDVQKGTCVRAFLGHQGNISTLAFSPDGKYLATSGEDLAIALWDLGSGRRIKTMTGHTASVYSLAFSAESTLLVSGGADWTVRCWDVKGAGGLRKPSAATASKDELGIETADLVHTLPTKRTPIVNVQFTSRNLCMVAGSYAPPEQRI